MSPPLAAPVDGRAWIGGERCEAAKGEKRPDIDPSTGEPFAEVSETGPEDVDQAIKVAKEVHRSGVWREMPVLERQRILSAMASGLRRRTLELARLVAVESGMPMHAARFIEVPMAADAFDFFAAAGTLVHGETLPFSLSGATTRYWVSTLRRPVGVVGLITPWNFPLLMPAWKVAAALASGSVVVLKPAPETPLTALALADVAAEAGLPPGVLSILPGGDHVGSALVAHPGVDKIALTGGSDTGRAVARAAAENLKRISLELGGKSANIVFQDADLDEAVSGALFGIFFNSGQVCQAGSRILVERSIADAFLERLVGRAAQLEVGPATDDMTDLGPLISHEQFLRVQGHVSRALEEHAGRLVLGEVPATAERGYYVKPTVFADVDPRSHLAQTEVFGPVASLLTFDGEKEALDLANGTVYGLAGAVWTSDVKRALRMAQGLDAGTVWVNAYQVLTPTAPFGGIKQSGYGKELGMEGISTYLDTQTVIVDLNEQAMQFF